MEEVAVEPEDGGQTTEDRKDVLHFVIRRLSSATQMAGTSPAITFVSAASRE
jgi:hypothetical protein